MKRTHNILLLLATAIVFCPFESLILFKFNVEFDFIRYPLIIISELLLICFIIKPTLKSNYFGKRLFYYALLIWSIVVLINTIPSFGLEIRKTKLFFSNILFIALFPFLLCVDLSNSIRPIFKFLKNFVWISLIVIVLYFFNPGKFNIEYLAYAFAAPVGILLMLSVYDEKNHPLIYLGIIILYLVINMVYARRAATLYLFFLCVSPMVLIKRASLSVRRSYYFLFIVIIVAFSLSISNFGFLFERFQTGFDSRGGVLEAFVLDFQKTNDWYLGRGFLGEVYGGEFLIQTERDTREGIENGWLLYVLKGGIPYALIILMLIVESIIAAFTKSQNTLCQAAGLYLIYTIFDMIGFGVPFTDFKTIAIFFAISICHNKRILSFSDNEIRYELYK